MSDVSGVPNKRQQKFILGKLIPFILREQGRGFGMDNWLNTGLHVGEEWAADYVVRKIPVCGIVCCIGGSIQVLKDPHGEFDHDFYGLTYLGLKSDESFGLFYNWKGSTIKYPLGWPREFADAFQKAKTPYRKALVAARLLKKIAREGGKCLHISENIAS